MSAFEEQVVDPKQHPDRWAPALESLLQEQGDVIDEIESLSDRQRALIAEGESDELITLLNRRDALSQRVVELAAAFEPYRARWGDLMNRLDDARRTRVADAVRVLSTRIRDLAARDDQDRAELTRRRQAVATELETVARGRGAVAAYNPSPESAPRYQDKAG